MQGKQVCSGVKTHRPPPPPPTYDLVRPLQIGKSISKGWFEEYFKQDEVDLLIIICNLVMSFNVTSMMSHSQF